MSPPNQVGSDLPESPRSTLNIGPERRLGTVALDDPYISQVSVSVAKIDATDHSSGYFRGLIYGVDVHGNALDIKLIEGHGLLHVTMAERLGLESAYGGPVIQLGNLITRIGGVYGIYTDDEPPGLYLYYDHELPDAPIMPRATGLAVATALMRTLGADMLLRHPDGPHTAPPIDITLCFASTPETPTLADTAYYANIEDFVCNAQPYGSL